MLCMALQAVAQTGGITGTILDEHKDPIIGAVITVTEGAVVKGGATTDVDGVYNIKPLKPGRYSVKAVYTAYKTQIVQGVIVSPGKTTEVQINMEPDVKQLNEVQITAYKVPLISKYRGPSTTVTSEQIEKMPTRTTNSVAATSPGTYNYSNDRVNIRGARNSGTRYMVHSIPVKRRNSKDHTNVVPQSKPLVYQSPGNESYKNEKENDFLSVKANPLSTLSVDVDRASYSNVRRFINAGQMPPAEAVRIEEMVNYFDYDYPQPEGEDPISIVTEMIDCPWKSGHKLLHIGIQAKEISTEKLPPSNIVFLIDVSGSMSDYNKLPLVKSALKMLAAQLREEDRLSIVVYAGNAGLVLPPTSGGNKQAIYSALDRLEAGGSTAGGAGIQLAYNTARENFMRGGNNRIVLATDGDFNVGVSSENELENLITKERDNGISLTCLGFGMGNYKDSKLELLADKGNGNYAYIDNEEEAHKTLVKEFGGTMFTIAKDVKAQIEFNPAHVASYRLVGYENRVLNAEDFKNDKKDAGDMGSGHTVTILYELVPAKHSIAGNDVDPLKYQSNSNVYAGNELATIKFRYKRPNANKSKEMVHVIPDYSKRIMHAGDNIRFASAVAMFGMLLKNSEHKGSSNYNTVLNLARSAKGRDKNGYRAAFISLVKTVNKSAEINEGDGDLSTLGWNGEE